MEPRRVRQRRDGCDRPDCQNLRVRFQGMCASKAILERERDALETRVRILAVRNDEDDGVMGAAPRIEPAYDNAHQQCENLHLMKSRLRALNALIKEQQDVQHRQHQIAPVTEMHAGLKAQREQNDRIGAEFDMTKFVQEEVLEEWLAKARVEAQPYFCGICCGPLAAGEAMMGKNCYHLFHPACIARDALHKTCPSGMPPRVDDHPYWVCTGVEDAAPPHVGERYAYALRDDVEQQLLEGRAPFPPNVMVACPECRQPYADKAYYDLCMKAINESGAAGEDPAAPDQSPQQLLASLRAAGDLLLLPVPGNDTQVMLVRAKIMRTPSDPRMDNMANLTRLAQANGYHFGPAGTEGGRAYVRPKEFDDVVDRLPPGAVLRQTDPRPQNVWEDTTDADGQPIRRPARVLRGGGTYKVDLLLPGQAAAGPP